MPESLRHASISELAWRRSGLFWPSRFLGVYERNVSQGIWRFDVWISNNEITSMTESILKCECVHGSPWQCPHAYSCSKKESFTGKCNANFFRTQYRVLRQQARDMNAALLLSAQSRCIHGCCPASSRGSVDEAGFRSPNRPREVPGLQAILTYHPEWQVSEYAPVNTGYVCRLVVALESGARDEI